MITKITKEKMQEFIKSNQQRMSVDDLWNSVRYDDEAEQGEIDEKKDNYISKTSAS